VKVLFAPEAEQDLNSAVDFLAGRSPIAAAHLVAGCQVLGPNVWPTVTSKVPSSSFVPVRP